jgi:hypothetical protein
MNCAFHLANIDEGNGLQNFIPGQLSDQIESYHTYKIPEPLPQGYMVCSRILLGAYSAAANVQWGIGVTKRKDQADCPQAATPRLIGSKFVGFNLDLNDSGLTAA